MTLEVCDLDQSMMAVMIGGLLKNDLKKLWTKIYPQDFSDMLVRAKKYARTEEAFADDPLASSIMTELNKECSPK